MHVYPGYPDRHWCALYDVQHHGHLLCLLVRPLLPGLHGAHYCSLRPLQQSTTSLHRHSLTSRCLSLCYPAVCRVRRSNSGCLQEKHHGAGKWSKSLWAGGARWHPGAGHVTAVVAGGLRPGVERDERGRGFGRSGFPLLATGVWPPRHAALYALVDFRMGLPQTAAIGQSKLKSCRVLPSCLCCALCDGKVALFPGTVSGSPWFPGGPSGSSGVCRHHHSRLLLQSHQTSQELRPPQGWPPPQKKSSCVWLCRTFCGNCQRLHTRVQDKIRVCWPLTSR